jgi:transposase InsO family protein
LERFSPEYRERHIEAPHTGALVAVDTFFVGVLKGVGKVYLQTAIDCYSRHAWARLYPNKLPVTAVQLINNDVLPTFETHGTKIDAVLSDNGREFCGRADRHPYELFLQLEDIEHKQTRVNRPQSNGIVERLHRTLLDEHFRVEGRRACRKTSLRNFGGNAFGLSTDTGTPSSFSASILKAASVNRLVDRAGSTSKSRSLCSVSVPLTTDPKTRGRDRPWRLTSCRNSPLCTARVSDGFMVVL